MDIRYYILIGALILVVMYYFFSKKYNWKLKSDVFTIVLFAITAVSLIMITHVKEEQMREDIFSYETGFVLYSLDNCSGKRFAHISYTCNKYYEYYSGDYLDDNQRPVLLINEESPQELIDYLDGENKVYEFKKYSIVELNLLIQTLMYDQHIDSENTRSSGFEIDVQENAVILYTFDPVYYEVMYHSYIELGMLKVISA